MLDLTTFFSNHPLLSLAAAIVLVLAMSVELARARRAVYDIKPQEVTQLLNHENAVIIDLRSSEDYKTGHIIHSLNVPQHEIRENPKKLDKYRVKPLVLICNSGREAQKIAALLLKNGYNAYSLAGGIRTWTEAHLPLVKE